MTPVNIVILGGGFGGVYAALELEKQLRFSSEATITLVSRDNFFLFTPMLHEVAASDLDITHIVSPLRSLLKRTTLFVGEIEQVNAEQRTVSVRHGFDGHVHALPFDHLVFAMGSVTNFFGLPGLEARALTMKTLDDAIHLRNRVIAALEEAGSECGLGERGLLSVVVAGGGFAGVETIAGINDFVREGLRRYPRIDPAQLRMVLVHAGPTILPELGSELGAYAEKQLASRGVEILTNARVSAVDQSGVMLDDGRLIPAHTVVWTAGAAPHPLLASLSLPHEKGRLKVDPTLAVVGQTGFWAIGDCAAVPDRRTGAPCPPTAQHALRQARVAARNVVASMRGRQKQTFDFQTLGQLAAIGRRTGVARIFGVTFSGFVAWWLWRTIYLLKLPRLEKKVRVALDWTLDLVFEKDLVQFISFRHSELAKRLNEITPRNAMTPAEFLPAEPAHIEATR